MPYLTVASGDLLTAAQWNTNVRDQTIASCTSLTRPTSPVSGQYIYETDTLYTYYWNNTAWTLVPPTASPTFTGTPAAPTAAAGTSTTQLATTAFANAAGGLVYVTSATVGSAVSSVTVSSAFSATYDNYRIVISNGTHSASGDNMTLQLSGITGITYQTAGFFVTYGTATVTAYAPAAATTWLVGFFGQNNTSVVMDVTNPFLTKRKGMSIVSSDTYNYNFNGQCTSATSATGFTLFPAAGTITGQIIRVYGYRQ